MNRLRVLRKAKGISSAELAKVLGLDESGIRRIERGERGFSMVSQAKAAAYFGVSVDYLLGVEPAELYGGFVLSVKRDLCVTAADPAAGAVSGLATNIEEPLRSKLELVLLLDSIKPEDLKELLALARTLSAKNDFE